MHAGTMRRGMACATALVLLGAVVATTGRRLDGRMVHHAGAEEVVYLPDARFLRPLVLGYHTVLADLLWFRTINYFGAHYATDRAYPWLARMCDIVTDLDPRAEHVYRFAGVILPWEAKDPDEGIRLLQKGLAAFPDSWRLHYHLGIVYYLFKHDDGAAAGQLGQASRMAGAPPLIARVVALLHARQHDPETTLAFLEQMRAEATSAQMRDVLDRSVEEARVALDLARLDELVRRYREREGHLPDSLDALIPAGLLRSVPPDRFRGTYVIDPSTGTVHSSTGRVPLTLHASPWRAGNSCSASSSGCSQRWRSS